MHTKESFTKENIDTYFKCLGKEFRKLNGTKIPAEIILIGGASILVNYGFRDSTCDIDAMIHASSAMKDAINRVGDEMNLPVGWLNSDFKNTKSYTPKIVQYSKFYKKFSNILEVRTISGEYLLAMKLMSGRQHKHDISDIVGVYIEEKDRGNLISLEKIEKAVCDLYGGWDLLPEKSKKLITDVLRDENPEILYETYKNREKKIREGLVEFDNKYTGVLNSDNFDSIVEMIQKRKE